MSRLPHGGPRVKNARETYVEQLPQGHGRSLPFRFGSIASTLASRLDAVHEQETEAFHSFEFRRRHRSRLPEHARLSPAISAP